MGRPPVPIAERFWARVTRTDGCWLWGGALNADGYGVINERIDGRRVMHYVHRFAYELLAGPIPDTYEVDHRCYVRHCVNPEHLEAVTRLANIRRQRPRPGWSAPRRSRCLSGRHELTSDNKLAQGRCRECRNEWKRAARRAGRNA